MHRTFIPSTALLLAALALPAMSVPVFAQNVPAQNGAVTAIPMATSPNSDAMAAKPSAMHHDRNWSPEERAKRVDAHIVSLHQAMGITTAQEQQWTVFAQVMRDNATRMTAGFETRGAHLATMSAAANMQSYADMAMQHAQDIQRLAMAFQSVYDSLSPAQKSTADTLFRARSDSHRQKAKHRDGVMAPSKP